MTPANAEQLKHTPWFAKAGAACSIVPIARFVGTQASFTLKGGGYGCLFSLTGVDEEGRTDQELDSLVAVPSRALCAVCPKIPAFTSTPAYCPALRCRVQDRHRQRQSPRASLIDRLTHLESRTRAFRRVDLHWCLTSGAT